MVHRNDSIWGLAEAKARLSEVLERSKSGPQIIQRRGRPIGVVVDFKVYGEGERRAVLGSAEHRMKAFLDVCAKIRAEGGVDLALPPREARKSPFSAR